MKISGFTMLRNGVLLDYPFVESIKSALPLVDEYVVVLGKSEDGTREKIVEINSPKIRIIDTVWDEELRKGGKILAQQTNVGLDAITGDWGIYLQADEILHEDELDVLRTILQTNVNNSNIDGLLFPYYHFWGYNHVVKSRRTYRYEIRVVKNDPSIRSYRDAQGFRKYDSKEDYENGAPGKKLRVKKLHNVHIYAYSRVREPEAELEKVKHIARYWHNDEWIEEKYSEEKEYDYNQVDIVEPFDVKNHPAVMKARVSSASWRFHYDKPRFTLKTWFLYMVEKNLGWRIGEYRNYKVVE